MCQFQIMIVDHKLVYPSGTATAHLINSFHTPQGANLVRQDHLLELSALLNPPFVVYTDSIPGFNYTGNRSLFYSSASHLALSGLFSNGSTPPAMTVDSLPSPHLVSKPLKTGKNLQNTRGF